jgi:hypothetical protein
MVLGAVRSFVCSGGVRMRLVRLALDDGKVLKWKMHPGYSRTSGGRTSTILGKMSAGLHRKPSGSE